MAGKPEMLIVTAPVLFDNFSERMTRGQRHRRAVWRIKFFVKWILNWKGARTA
jgi:hypothetical protein